MGCEAESQPRACKEHLARFRGSTAVGSSGPRILALGRRRGDVGPPTSQGLYSLLHAKRSNCWRAPQEMWVVVQYRARVLRARQQFFLCRAPSGGTVPEVAW